MVEGLRGWWGRRVVKEGGEGDLNGRYDIHVTGLTEFGQLLQLVNLFCDIITILRENLGLYYLYGK